MESVARQFATKKDVAVIRNGFFSFRWTEILEMGEIANSHTVLKARATEDGPTPQFAPVPIEEVTKYIAEHKPGLSVLLHSRKNFSCSICTPRRNSNGYYSSSRISSSSRTSYPRRRRLLCA
jgi:hypothetical protein